jgi:hemerythrin-like domain-containing protein
MQPLKRHPSLIELSKDHHFGLLLSWKIGKGKEFGISADRIANYILNFFETDLIFHFKEEEELLFNKMPEEDPLRIRVEKEHHNIYNLVNKLKEKPTFDSLDEFAVALTAHIRFEERELFNYLQENFSDELLENIATELKKRHRPQTSMWTDNFWIKK